MSVAEARGDATKTLFTPPLDPNRIKVNYVIREANESERLSAISRTDFRKLNIDANIKETADRTLIYFPYGSTSKLNNSRVESYLNDVAERVKASGERVILTGHTDNDSSTQYNLGLGQRRADVVKNYLISKGVSTSKISATSKGESQPIASNDTAAGMAKNRRTELQISN